MIGFHDTAVVYRPGKRNRDGDATWTKVGTIDQCLFQPGGMSAQASLNKADGGQTMYAAEENSALYVRGEADVQVGDHIEVRSYRSRVTSPPVEHRFPSGRRAGLKINLTEVRKW